MAKQLKTKRSVVIAHFSTNNEEDFLPGLDTLVQYIAEKDKTDEIQLQTFECKTAEKIKKYDKIIQNINKLGFKWNSMVTDSEKRFKDIYRIKLLSETQEDYTKKNW